MNDSPENFLDSANTLISRRDLAAAVAAFNNAEAQEANADACAGGRWIAHMLAGDFAAAWRESDAIRERGSPDPHRFWTGDSPRGRRVMLRCLHGFGDAVQFLRYAPRLRGLASRLTVEVPPAMAALARYFSGVDDVITWGDAAPEFPPQWDVQIEVMELPYLFRTEAFELPIAERYLRLPENMTAQAAQYMGFSRELRRIGIVWAAGEWNASRSLPLEYLHPLLKTSGCEFWSLQGGDAQGEWRALQPSIYLRDASGCGNGIPRLAAAIHHMDLIITVDTLAAHLAGAMNKPAWVLLQYDSDWRWMLQRSDSLWYPSLRLFRQAAPGDWQTVMTSVQRELTMWLQEKAACTAR